MTLKVADEIVPRCFSIAIEVRGGMAGSECLRALDRARHVDRLPISSRRSVNGGLPAPGARWMAKGRRLRLRQRVCFMKPWIELRMDSNP